MAKDRKNKNRKQELIKRSISAAVLIPCVLALVYAGSILLILLLLAAGVLGIYELYQMYHHASRQGNMSWKLMLGMIAYSCLFILSLTLLYQIRLDDQGFQWVIQLLVVIWAVDTGAYFIGSRVGGPKLAPSISPSKTISGALGGLVAAAVVSFIFARIPSFDHVQLSVWQTMGIAILAQAGDLLESKIKRRCQVKDSGHLIPGHGGILDRIDAIPLAAILYYCFI